MKIELEGTWPEIQLQCAQILGVARAVPRRLIVEEFDGKAKVYSIPRDPAASERAWAVLRDPLQNTEDGAASFERTVNAFAAELLEAGFTSYEIRHTSGHRAGSL